MAFALRSSSWPLQWPLAAIAVAAVLYYLGGRASATPATAVKRWRGAAFYAGLLGLVVAVDSPVDAYAGRLFFVHMFQHVLLAMIAPPLLVIGRPWPRLSRPLPLSARRPLARIMLAGPTLLPVRRAFEWLASPLPAFALFNGVLLAWHVPALYDLTLKDGLVHDLEHGLFFGTALLFWTNVIPTTGRPRLSEGQRVAYTVAGLLVGWLLAVVLGLAPDPLYTVYAALGHRPLGLSALSDQHLAAGIMWVPASIPYSIAIYVAAYAWLDPGSSVRGQRRAVVVDDLRPREI
ncbi:MAG TPA: cytochrome c oxidase assembly protein [Gaiellaceae bacterium]|nr:cytochrome c oxidase assembly protein [Gaiellaceae bacterium]